MADEYGGVGKLHDAIEKAVEQPEDNPDIVAMIMGGSGIQHVPLPGDETEEVVEEENWRDTLHGRPSVQVQKTAKLPPKPKREISEKARVIARLEPEDRKAYMHMADARRYLEGLEKAVRKSVAAYVSDGSFNCVNLSAIAQDMHYIENYILGLDRALIRMQFAQTFHLSKEVKEVLDIRDPEKE